jgi:hypothetical protein
MPSRGWLTVIRLIPASRHRSILMVASVVALWAIPTAIFAVAVTVPQSREKRAVSQPDSPVARIGSRVAAHTREATITIQLPGPVGLFAASAGVVTTVHESLLGNRPKAGQPVFEIDGVPVLAAMGARPLFRELRLGDSGRAVTDLNSVLQSMKLLNTNPGSSFTADTKAAVEDLQSKLGVKTDGVFRPSYTLYVPAGLGTLDSFGVSPGEQISAGEQVATGMGVPSGIRFETTAAGGTPLGYGKQAVRLTAGTEAMEVSSIQPPASELPAILSFLRESQRRGDVSTNGDASTSIQFTGATIALAKVPTFGAVAATAVYTLPSGTSCVFVVADPARLREGINAVTLPSVLPESTEPGVAFLPQSLVGKTVVVHPLALSSETRQLCA